MPRGYIYKYTFPDGKVYIGQIRRPPEERHREHFDNTIGKANPEFWEAYQKVGTPEFEVVETFECDRVQDLVQQLNESEAQYIQQFKAANPKYGYNVRESAYVAIPRDAVLDAEFERIWIERAEKWYPTFVSVQNKCFHTFEPLDEDELKFCKKILRENVLQGAVTELGFDFQNLKVNSEDARFFFYEALSYAEMVFCEDNWGEIRNYIEENKEKILSEKLPETTIIQIDKNGKVVKEYVSPSEIRDELGISNLNNIYNALEGKQRHAYGYIWRYKKDLVEKKPQDRDGQLDIDFGE